MALVVLLRGVNVGGHRTFRPAKFVEQLRHLDAVNIGATGVFVIRGAVSRTQLRSEIATKLPFETGMMICDGREFAPLLSHAAFKRVAADEVRFVSVLSRRPRPMPKLPLTMPAEGRWLLKLAACEGRFVLGVYRRDMKVIGYLGQLDRIFGVPLTTRNWNTIAAIVKAIDSGARTLPPPQSNSGAGEVRPPRPAEGRREDKLRRGGCG